MFALAPDGNTSILYLVRDPGGVALSDSIALIHRDHVACVPEPGDALLLAHLS